jgi:recombination protein RecA
MYTILIHNSIIMNKQEALNNALAMIEKQFGKGSIMKLGDKDGGLKIETTSSGSLSLDMAL